MVTYKEFEALKAILKLSDNECSESQLMEHIKSCIQFELFSTDDEIQSLICSLRNKGYLQGNEITSAAMIELQPCKVNNAVILAAGGSDISAKSVYSMPKGLYKKNGETLIERQIRQLKESGIEDITIVVGYKQELYFYLVDKCGVNLVINPDLKKNNIYSLYVAENELKNTYICNCDNYFEINPFSQYEYHSYQATVYKQDASNELLVKVNESGRILDVYSGDPSGECIYGHAYVDNAFSKRLVKYMDQEISNFRITPLFWQEFVAKHVDNLDMYVRRYTSDIIYEFDSIQEIQNIDSLFLENVSRKVNEKICDVLHCKMDDIKNVEILQKGLTNVLFTFIVNGQKYIFRYPGESSTFFIYRKNEVRAQLLAAKAHTDDTYLYIDESGIKISKFVENCKNLKGIYYKDMELMKRVAKKIRNFHEEGYGMSDWKEFNYNPIEQGDRLMAEASKMKGNLFEVFKNEHSAIVELFNYTERDGIAKTMCHNDINQDNCLLTDTSLDIIDWEFAGWNDPAYDFGRVIADYDFDDEAIDIILEAYFGRKATAIERLHWIAYCGIHNWYYVNWALYKESINESSRDWLVFFYKMAKRVLKYALPKYREIYG